MVVVVVAVAVVVVEAVVVVVLVVLVVSVLKSGLVRFLDPNEAQPQPQPVWTAHPYSGNRTEPSTTGLQQSICGLATSLDYCSLDQSFNTLYKSLHKKNVCK